MSPFLTQKDRPMSTEVKAVELKESTLELATRIKPLVTVENGTFQFDKDTFETTLPESLDIKTVKAVQNHIQTFEAAANVAAGEVGIEYLAANPDATALLGNTKVGNDTYNIAMARMQSVSAGIGVGRKDVPGNITSGIKTSNPEAKRSIHHVRNLAERLRDK